MATRLIYTGEYSRLVLAFHVGTRYSSVSYCLLHPGSFPEIQYVQIGYPGRSKIPSIIVYDPNGDVRAVGAEAEFQAIKDEIEKRGLFVAKWFMLHLQSPSLQTQTTQCSEPIQPLPPGKTVIKIFADMLRHLFSMARKHIIQRAGLNDTEIRGLDKDVILSHPNGWEGAQQTAMCQAAILAGLIPDTEEGRDGVRFVTEGEANLHYCIFKGVSLDRVKEGDTVIVVNAGEETIDISVHRRESNLLFEEAAPPQCHFHGSSFITQRVKAYLRESLRGSRYYDMFDHIAECFDTTIKMSHHHGSGKEFITFGSTSDTDTGFNIQEGRLMIEGSQSVLFFQPSIDCIARSIEGSYKAKRTRTVCLVGSFAYSNYLFVSIRSEVPRELPLYRPDNYTGNAVAIGAILFHLHHFAAARVLMPPDLSNAAPGIGNGFDARATQTGKITLRPQAQPLPEIQPSTSEVATGQTKDGEGDLGGIKYKMWTDTVKILDIPQFGYHTTLDLTALHDILPILNAHIPVQYLPQSHQSSSSAVTASRSALYLAPAPPGVRESFKYTELAYLPIFLKTLSKAMMEWPLFSSSIAPSTVNTNSTTKPSLTPRPYSDINIALQTPSGLYTPTLQRVNTHSIYSLTSKLEHLSYLGRQTPSGLTTAEIPKDDGMITVSNIGEIGDCDFTSPVLVPGGGIAIVAIGRPKWVWDVDKGTGKGKRRFKVGISWSADYQVVKNEQLAGFVECWRGYVENPQRLIGEGV